MTKPISPKEVVATAVNRLPSFVIAAFNELIVSNWTGHKAVVKQDDVIKVILSKNNEITREDIFDKCFLDVEKVFEEEGWKVEYDKPAYCELFEPYFVFSMKSS